jgi:hypothetical protein
MIHSLNNGSTSSGGEGLTPAQRQLLGYFNSMTASAQTFVLDLAQNNARVFPRQRPKLRVIGGRSA